MTIVTTTTPVECQICAEQATEFRGHPHPSYPQKIIDQICRPCFAKIYAHSQIDDAQFGCPLCKIHFAKKYTYNNSPVAIREWIRPKLFYFDLLQNELSEKETIAHATGDPQLIRIEDCLIQTYTIIIRLMNVYYQTDWNLIANEKELYTFTATCKDLLRVPTQELHELIMETAPDLLAKITWPSFELSPAL